MDLESKISHQGAGSGVGPSLGQRKEGKLRTGGGFTQEWGELKITGGHYRRVDNRRKPPATERAARMAGQGEGVKGGLSGGGGSLGSGGKVVPNRGRQ